MATTNTFWQTRIDALAISIPIYEAAIDALGTGGVQEYLIDTGQTRQRVTKLDLVALQKTLDSMLNRYTTACARINGAASIGRPAW